MVQAVQEKITSHSRIHASRAGLSLVLDGVGPRGPESWSRASKSRPETLAKSSCIIISASALKHPLIRKCCSDGAHGGKTCEMELRITISQKGQSFHWVLQSGNQSEVGGVSSPQFWEGRRKSQLLLHA